MAPIAPCSAEHREGDTRRAYGRFVDRISTSRDQVVCEFQVVKDGQRDAVFGATARVERFGFEVDRAVGGRGEGGEVEEGGVANAGGDGGAGAW